MCFRIAGKRSDISIGHRFEFDFREVQRSLSLFLKMADWLVVGELFLFLVVVFVAVRIDLYYSSRIVNLFTSL